MRRPSVDASGAGDPVGVEDPVDALDGPHDVPEVAGVAHLEREVELGHPVARRRHGGRVPALVNRLTNVMKDLLLTIGEALHGLAPY